MKITTGVDIVGIERMDKAIDQWGDRFLQKIFTKKELMQAKERGLSAQHLAGKFAAKEAVFKALSEFRNGESLQWCDIEILNYTDGRPQVSLHKGAESVRKKFVLSQIQVSIAHDKQWAVASAVIVSEHKNTEKATTRIHKINTRKNGISTVLP